ncbi:MAG TPA: DMT family transporter [Bacteroidetes bacterium]|nr:DMT family transporter [Bacteroidota bacterium]
MQTHQTKAYLYTGAAVLLWSTVASAFKIALRELDYIQLLFFASMVSLVSLFMALLVQGKIALLRQSTKRQLLHSMLLGLINPTLYYLVLFRAYDLLPAQEAQPLNWTWPIMLSILSAPLLKQKLTIRTIIAIVISFSGVILIATRGNVIALRFTSLTGDLLAIGSSVLWALFWIFNLRDRRDPTVRLFLCFLFGNIYNLVVMALLSGFTLPTLTGFAGGAYVGLFEMGITFVIWLKALSLSKDSASVGIMAYITPFLSLIFIHFILGETILVTSVLGLGLIVAGILLQMKPKAVIKGSVL